MLCRHAQRPRSMVTSEWSSKQLPTTDEHEEEGEEESYGHRLGH